MRRAAVLAFLALVLVACSSPRSIVRIKNVGTQPVTEVELNYGRMFGIADLRPGEARERNVPIPEPADLTVRFYDSDKQLRTSKGPHVEKDSAGVIEVRIGDAGQVEWDVNVHPK